MNKLLIFVVVILLLLAGKALVKGVSNGSFQAKSEDSKEVFARNLERVKQRQLEREQAREEINETLEKNETGVQSEDARDYRIHKFREANLTQNFYGAVETSLSGFIFEDKKPNKVKIEMFQTPGVHVQLNGEPHLLVKSYSQIIHGERRVSSRSLTYIKGGSIVEIKNIDDKSVTRYEWLNVPATMKIGTEVKVGKVREEDEKGNTVANGEIFFSLQFSGSSIEFCQVEVLLEGGKPKERVERECRVFDRSGKVQKVVVMISTDGNPEVVLEGAMKVGNIDQPPYARN